MGLNQLLQLFSENLLPVLLTIGTGYLAARYLNLEPRSLSRVTFYIFSPCLLFTLLTESELSNGDIIKMAGFTVANLLLVGTLAWLIGKLLRFERRILAGVVITSMLVNAGNFGLAVVMFGFGETALAYASVFFVTNAILAYTAGVVIASLGTQSVLRSIATLVKVPAVYAMVLALVFVYFNWRLPLPVERAANMLGDASIPAMLVLLGMQLRSVNLAGNVTPLVVASTMRLVVSPVIALGLSALFQLQGPFRQAGVLQSAMPAAVLTTVIATEYEVVPELVTSVVFATTLIGVFTLTPLLAFLGA